MRSGVAKFYQALDRIEYASSKNATHLDGVPIDECIKAAHRALYYADCRDVAKDVAAVMYVAWLTWIVYATRAPTTPWIDCGYCQ